MWKNFFIYLVGTICFVFFILMTALAYSQVGEWRLMTLPEATKFISEDVFEEDVVIIPQEGGIRTVRVVFGLPSKEDPFIWIARLTKNASDEKEKFFQKYLLKVGWLYPSNQAPKEDVDLITEKKPSVM